MLDDILCMADLEANSAVTGVKEGVAPAGVIPDTTQKGMI